MHDSNPRALFNHVAEQLNARNIAFIFAREALDRGDQQLGRDVRHIFKGAFIVNEGLTQESAEQAIARSAMVMPARIHDDGESFHCRYHAVTVLAVPAPGRPLNPVSRA